MYFIRWKNLCGLFTLAALCITIFGGCVATREEIVLRRRPTFDYMPEEDIAGKTGITFAVIGSQFGQNPGYPSSPYPYMDPSGGGSPIMMVGLPSIPMFNRFSSNMAADFGEIITARGYTLRGPFPTFDDMTFVDKSNSNLILTAQINFNFDTSNIRVISYSKYWEYTGSIYMNPRVTLLIHESLTNEKMWTKSVNITPIALPIGISKWNSPNVSFKRFLEVDNAVYSALGMQLEAMYKEILNRTYGYLDPREVDIIAKQAQDLRARKTF